MTSEDRTEPVATPASRRRVLLGAGAATAAVAAAQLVPVAAELPADAAAPVPENGGGYRLSQHVLRYYETTKV